MRLAQSLITVHKLANTIQRGKIYVHNFVVSLDFATLSITSQIRVVTDQGQTYTYASKVLTS